LISHFVYGYPLSASDLVTWAWYAAIVLLGSLLASNASPLRVVSASLLASVSFFAVSNFAVWAVWNMYPKTLAGLAECYTMAVPFFRNTAASDLLFSGAVFGVAALLPQLARKAQRPVA
jgi:CHASE2 domain-containing sensor protein